MPTSKSITFPSGLKLLVRGTIASDYDLLAAINTEGCNEQELMDNYCRFLERTVVDTVDTGPYGDRLFVNGKFKIPQDFLIGDYWFFLLSQHEISKPDVPYTAFVVCPQCKAYRERVEMKLGVASENDGLKDKDGFYRLPVIEYPKESMEIYKNGNLFDAVFNGKKIKVSLATLFSGTEADKLISQKYKDKKFTVSVATRLKYVEGLETQDIDERAKWVGQLYEEQLDEFTDIIEEIEGGIDLTIEPFCPKCKESFVVDVEIDHNFFSSPQRKKKNRRRKRWLK